MRILLIYHFFHPDSVVSARIYTDLALALVKDGHAVTVFTSDCFHRGEARVGVDEKWRGIQIFRFSRPRFNQSKNAQRLLNSLFIQLKWLRGFWRWRDNFDLVVVGTDPQFAYMMFPILRLMNRRAKMVHWVFDLYPEALFASSPRWMCALASVTRPFVPLAYHFVDMMVDIGGCMRQRLAKYSLRCRQEAVTPWALVEPDEVAPVDVTVRQKLFGQARLGLLYSGTVGHAHDLSPLIALARACRLKGLDVGFCYAGCGAHYDCQTAVITDDDTNIRLAGFADEKELDLRLAAADIHMVSVRESWDGIVVPSKFFGAIAIGRPVIFAGSDKSSVSEYIQRYDIGRVISGMDVTATTAWLEELLQAPHTLRQYQRRAFSCYHDHFSREKMCRHFSELLCETIR
jgi:colanic acid biosynthesis glycosyl transferase WcaI